MSLTTHQKEILDQALLKLKSDDRLLIKGSAGTGKTFLTNTLIQELLPTISGFIYCSAPTNKAVAVLKDKINITSNRIQLITTHSALKLKRFIDNNGQKSFKPSYDSRNPPLSGVGLFIIDESSMIPLSLLLDIEKHSILNKCKVIFLGDDKQLNPVNEENSPVFLGEPIIFFKNNEKSYEKYTYFGLEIKEYSETEYLVHVPYPEVELTEIVRQKGGNPIIDLSRQLELTNSKVPVILNDNGYIFSSDQQKIIKTLAHVNGTDELKFLAYTNNTVNAVNNAVRKSIYGNPKKIEVNETLVFDEPYKEKYITNEEILVDRIEIRQKKLRDFLDTDTIKNIEFDTEFSLRYYSINYSETNKIEFKPLLWKPIVKNDIEIIDDILVIHEDSEKDFNEICKKLKILIKNRSFSWVRYYDFIENFASMKYNHAITIHKSQGSTYKQTIVDMDSMRACRNPKERQRLLYTAITRASDLLILYNKE